MGYWNWINDVYDYDQACAKIDELNEEVSQLRLRLNQADKVILGLMEQHIGLNANTEWNMSYMSSDENAIDYEQKYQLLTTDKIGDICE